MSEFVGGIVTDGPIVDDRIKDIISIASNAVIPPEITVAMSRVLTAVADQMDKEHITANMPVCCLFSNSDTFTISLTGCEQAICLRTAMYSIPNLVKTIGTDKLYTILAEELCHLIWDIRDEVLVNFKVLDVLRNISPDLQMTNIYSPQEVAACHTYLRDHPAFWA